MGKTDEGALILDFISADRILKYEKYLSEISVCQKGNRFY